ncbi:MAG TPA: hypothetical protein VH092_34770, partial [Urbifossiella sp.]|nr:hypothetical protein [Urbifossiella sp.]
GNPANPGGFGRAVIVSDRREVSLGLSRSQLAETTQITERNCFSNCHLRPPASPSPGALELIE